MERISNHPIKNLTDLLKKHKAFSRGNFSKIVAFYTKLVLQEPFRIREEIKYHRDINRHTLRKAPVFIIGHWRSGTSFLQYLLSRDPQFGYMNKFQVVFPDIFLGSEQLLKPLVDRIPETLNLLRDAGNMSINLDLDSPSEIEIALSTMISPGSLHWGHIFPQDAWHYFNKHLFFETATDPEIQQWKRDYTHLINKTSLKNDSRRLLIKSPGNTARIRQLLELYPDARFIFIHRNPYDVFYSSKKLWNTLLDNLALQEFSPEQRNDAIISLYEKLMKTYLQQRAMVPAGRLVEIRFNKFVNNPVRVLSSVYHELRLPGFEEAEPHFEAYLSAKPGDKPGSYNYETDIIDKLSNRWKFAFYEWNYSINNVHASVKDDFMARKF